MIDMKDYYAQFHPKPRKGDECKKTECERYESYKAWRCGGSNLNFCRECKNAHVSEAKTQEKNAGGECNVRSSDLLGGYPYRLVAVEWVDSYGCAAHWGQIPDTTPNAHHCYSAGWLARESDEVLVIVPHISPANKEIDTDENGCGDMTIPKCSIRKIIDLTPNA